MSDKRLFVGNLPWSSNENDLKTTFASVGVVVKANIVIDRETGRSRGFGFVEMATTEEAAKACETLDGKDMNGRIIKVNFATEKKPRTDRPYQPRPSYQQQQPAVDPNHWQNFETNEDDRYARKQRYKDRRY